MATATNRQAPYAHLGLVVLDEQAVERVLALSHWRATVGDLARRTLAATHRRLNALVAVGLALVLERDALRRAQCSSENVTLHSSIS